jgi:Lon protease-like protein
VPAVLIAFILVVGILQQPASPATVPAEIPLFPLPETSLFPGVSRPFLIYEPRYREMIADAMKGNKIIGMVRLRPGFEKDYEGRPPIYGIGCAGTIEEYEQLPDGRYVILLRGLTTFRIVSEDGAPSVVSKDGAPSAVSKDGAPSGARKPYRLARIEAVPELLKDEDRLALSTLRNRIEKLLVTLLPLGVDPPDASLEDDEFVNIVAQNFGMPEATRQELLERNRVIERARALADLLDKK